MAGYVSRRFKKGAIVIAAAAICAAHQQFAYAAGGALYWDTNGSTAGAKNNTASGLWDTETSNQLEHQLCRNITDAGVDQYGL